MSSAGTYDVLGRGYARQRRPDPRIAAAVERALGDSKRVVNVGAGTGSYEPPGRAVVGVEPSAVMIGQRPAGAAPCVQARAEAMPFADGAFDAALAVLTTHHWADPGAGLSELVRVSRVQVVLTWDHQAVGAMWLLRDYFPEVLDLEADLASLDEVLVAWPDADVQPVPLPADCVDGFLAAYWRRPEAYLDPEVRSGISSFARLPADVLDAGLARLADDLASGRWQARNADLLDASELDCGYRLAVRRSSR